MSASIFHNLLFAWKAFYGSKEAGEKFNKMLKNGPE
jgi:hypothetical protein